MEDGLNGSSRIHAFLELSNKGADTVAEFGWRLVKPLDSASLRERKSHKPLNF